MMAEARFIEHMNSTAQARSGPVMDSRPIDDIYHPNRPPAPFPQQPAIRSIFREYNMHHHSRGLAITINIKKFDPRLKLQERLGSELDCSMLELTFCRLGFEQNNIRTFYNLTVENIQRLIADVAAIDFTYCDCLTIAFLSHGSEGYVFGYDMGFDMQSLWEPFTAERCPTLAGKPKLFFIQVSLGELPDSGDRLRIDGRIPELMYKMPSQPDFLIAFSSVLGFKSYEGNKGSWFIQSIHSIFEEYGLDEDIYTLLTYVNQKIGPSQTFHSRDLERRQIPYFVSMLTKKVYFRPKH